MPPYLFDRLRKCCMHLSWEMILGKATELLFPSCFRFILECISKSSHSCCISANTVFLFFCRFNLSLLVLLVQLQPLHFCSPSLPPLRTQWPWSCLKMTRQNREHREPLVMQREDTELLRTANHTTYMKWGNNSLGMKITSFPPFHLCSYTTLPLSLSSVCLKPSVCLLSFFFFFFCPSYFQDETE